MITPCISVCRLNPERTACVGCKRTLQELQDWVILSDKQREIIMDDIRKRRMDSE